MPSEISNSENRGPEILAPAGDMRAALAAFAAGADAVYLGLKHFSARMEAENFSSSDLRSLLDVAHTQGRRVYVALNTLIKPGELPKVYSLIRRSCQFAAPDALIAQDPALPALAREAGFTGELHLSTLSNITHQAALIAGKALGANRIILPRELSLEELRLLNAACPKNLDLEFFVHGALCFCVSGRCWWSSYMGGKSGLRGRCVQPCRRVYAQKGRTGRFFSSLDLSLDVLTRELLPLTRIKAWKIEGRKKGPHYVYHVTKAYCLLRDAGDNPESRREAMRLIGMALGRSASHSSFLDRGAKQPPNPGDQESQTSSGLLCGKIRIRRAGGYEIVPRLPLQRGDYLRVGREDEIWHCALSLNAPAPEGQTLILPLPKNKHPKAGVPVLLIDRRTPEVEEGIAEWEGKLGKAAPGKNASPAPHAFPKIRPYSGKAKKSDVYLRSSLPHGREGKENLGTGAVQGLWLSPKALRTVSRTLYSRIHWWLPPVIWPDEERQWQHLVHALVRDGARHIVCNTPWQIAFFPKTENLALCAGPFCNLANASALEAMRKLGFSAAIVSPEPGQDDLLALPAQSPLPLGIVISGFWPVGIARHKAELIQSRLPFMSPRGEEFFLRRYGENAWIYPSWPLDLSARKNALEEAGYLHFIHMEEHAPQNISTRPRPGDFNWDIGLL
ncbi:MAG: U32 family peptidase [Desulfovibrio sp.]|jgi:putative protease|nr:U32 family peptidase [Desulfovibrio sp.]